MRPVIEQDAGHPRGEGAVLRLQGIGEGRRHQGVGTVHLLHGAVALPGLDRLIGAVDLELDRALPVGADPARCGELLHERLVLRVVCTDGAALLIGHSGCRRLLAGGALLPGDDLLLDGRLLMLGLHGRGRRHVDRAEQHRRDGHEGDLVVLDEIEELVEHIAPFRHALKSMPFAQPQRTGPLAPKMRTHSSTVLSRIWEVFAV